MLPLQKFGANSTNDSAAESLQDPPSELIAEESATGPAQDGSLVSGPHVFCFLHWIEGTPLLLVASAAACVSSSSRIPTPTLGIRPTVVVISIPRIVTWVTAVRIASPASVLHVVPLCRRLILVVKRDRVTVMAIWLTSSIGLFRPLLWKVVARSEPSLVLLIILLLVLGWGAVPSAVGPVVRVWRWHRVAMTMGKNGRPSVGNVATPIDQPGAFLHTDSLRRVAFRGTLGSLTSRWPKLGFVAQRTVGTATMRGCLRGLPTSPRKTFACTPYSVQLLQRRVGWLSRIHWTAV